MTQLKRIHVSDDLEDLIFLHVDPDAGCVEPEYPADAFLSDDDEEFEQLFVQWQLLNRKDV